MKKTLTLIIIILVFTNIIVGQALSQTDKLSPKDLRDIFQLAIDLPDIQQYYHIGYDSTRQQIIFQDFGKGNHEKLSGVTKFGRQVIIMTETELKQRQIKNYFVIGDLRCETNSVKLQLSYIGEGLSTSYTFKKTKDHWIITDFKLMEK